MELIAEEETCESSISSCFILVVCTCVYGTDIVVCSELEISLVILCCPVVILKPVLSSALSFTSI